MPAPDAPPPTNQPASLKPRRPNKRAAKLGLTDEDFKPSDDILQRMQKAWELGVPLEDLDAALAAQSGTPAPAAAATAPITDLEREERLRRVLERLDGGDGEDNTAAIDADGRDVSEAATTASTVTEAVAQLEAAGYHDRMELGDSQLTCDVCGAVHSPDVIVVDRVLRFEGPSDPADEAMVLALRCPECDARSTLVSAFGPDADPRLADAFVYLAARARHR
jgi:DNA-binding transcriptional MerR regulator